MKSLCLVALALSLASAAASAQTPCRAENDGPNYSNNVGMTGAIVAVKFVPSATILVSRAEIFTGESGLSHFLAIWSHDFPNNQPLAILSTGTFTMQPANGWQGTDIPPVMLTANTAYWLAMTPPAGAQASIDMTNTAVGQPFCSSVNNGLTWSGPLQFAGYNWKLRLIGPCNTAPIAYCTSGTSTNGCTPQLVGSSSPNVAHTLPCTLSVWGVEGQKSGILFYGLSSYVQPWCTSGGGASFLCVKPPTQRTIAQSSGGTLATCDGSFVFDWNAYQTSQPLALGQPWSVGAKVYAQAWYRDPPACKTTNLTNAVELTYLP